MLVDITDNIPINLYKLSPMKLIHCHQKWRWNQWLSLTLRSVSYLKANLNTLRREKDEEESGAAQAESTTMWVDKHVGGT